MLFFCYSAPLCLCACFNILWLISPYYYFTKKKPEESPLTGSLLVFTKLYNIYLVLKKEEEK